MPLEPSHIGADKRPWLMSVAEEPWSSRDADISDSDSSSNSKEKSGKKNTSDNYALRNPAPTRHRMRPFIYV